MKVRTYIHAEGMPSLAIKPPDFPSDLHRLVTSNWALRTWRIFFPKAAAK